jgi:hypothetical protein
LWADSHFEPRAALRSPPSQRSALVTNYDQADLREAAFQAGAFAFVGNDDLLKLVYLLEREQL